jgi:hypothetical protein
MKQWVSTLSYCTLVLIENYLYLIETVTRHLQPGKIIMADLELLFRDCLSINHK